MGLSHKQIVTLALLMLGSFVAILNQTVVAPVLPSIMSEMGVNAADAQWLTSGFTLMNAIMIPITAFLTDRFPTRCLFVAAMGIFAVGSLLAGWGPSFAVLLGGRLVQAAGAGILLPLVMTVLLRTFPFEKRGSAMGIYAIVIAFAPAIGPTVAGIIIDHATWHDIFFGIAALSSAVAIAAAVVLKSADHVNKDVKLDVLSVVLSTLGFGGLLYGLSTLGSSGPTPSAVVGTMLGMGSLVLFFRRQLRMEHPMLQVRVLQNRRFLVAVIIVMLVQGALLAAIILVPIYLQSLMGYSATVSGLVLLPGALIMAVMGPIAGRLFDRHGPRMLALVGMGMLTITTFCFSLLGPHSGIIMVAALYTVRLFGLSLVNMPITTWGLNALPTEIVNHGTSVNNTLRQVAGSLGTALIISASTTVTNASAPSMGQAAASFFGVDVSFGLSAALCLTGFVLVAVLVKNKPDTSVGRRKHHAHKRVVEVSG